MSRRIEKALELAYEVLDLLAYVDTAEGDKATNKMSQLTYLLEGEFSRPEDDIDPDDDEAVTQIELDFHEDR